MMVKIEVEKEKISEAIKKTVRERLERDMLKIRKKIHDCEIPDLKNISDYGETLVMSVSNGLIDSSFYKEKKKELKDLTYNFREKCECKVENGVVNENSELTFDKFIEPLLGERDFNVEVEHPEKQYKFKGDNCNVQEKTLLDRLGLTKEVNEKIKCDKIEITRIKKEKK